MTTPRRQNGCRLGVQFANREAAFWVACSPGDRLQNPNMLPQPIACNQIHAIPRCRRSRPLSCSELELLARSGSRACRTSNKSPPRAVSPARPSLRSTRCRFGRPSPAIETMHRNDCSCAGFWTPATPRLSARSARRRPKSAKARSRGKFGSRLGGERYGDLMLAPHSMEGATLARGDLHAYAGAGQEARKASPSALEGYQRPTGRIDCRGLGREGSPPAWSRRKGTGKRRRAEEVWLMTCRTCSASAATLARSRARTPR